MDYYLGPQRQEKEYPTVKANIFSKLLFGYILPLFKSGFRKDLQEKDLYDVPPDFQAKVLGDNLESKWKQQKSKGRMALLILLWHCYGRLYFLFGFIQLFVSFGVIVIQPIAIGKFISYFNYEQTTMTKFEAYYNAAIIVLINLVQAIFNNNYYLKLIEIGIKARTALCSLIYRKALQLKSTDLEKMSIGNIVTLITKDVEVFGKFVECANDIWIGILKTLIAMAVLYSRISIVTLLPITVFLFLLPIQIYLGRHITKIRVKLCGKTDERLQFTKEFLNAIKFIKMYTWEDFFLERIKKSRKQEVKLTFHLYILRFLLLVIGIWSQITSFYGMILLYRYLGNTLSAEIYFFLVRCYTQLSHTISDLLPNGIAQSSEFYAAIIRITSILNYEVPKENNKIRPTNSPLISLHNISLQYGSNCLLTNVNVTLETGLNVLTGCVGSGKTTLLKSILGDYRPYEGKIYVFGRLSYASQIPWLFPSTVKQNILFGQPRNELRYQQVIDICALEHDLNMLPNGDQTIVEENGANFSVGQQARINLARALYKEADIYLLDDCLAALDPQISEYIFNKAILEFLEGKLILMTSYNYIRKCNNLLVIGGQTLTRAENKAKNNELKPTPNIASNGEKLDTKNYGYVEDTEKDTEFLKLVDDVPRSQLYYETQNTGQVAYKIYHKCVQLGGGYSMFFGVFLTFVVSQCLDSLIDIYSAEWINTEEIYANYTYNNATLNPEFEQIELQRNNIIILNGVIRIVYILIILTRLSLFVFTRKVSVNLHKKMINGIADANMDFFDNNYLGNILNRFSKDLITIDEQLPFVLQYIFIAALLLFGIVISLCVINITFLIPTAVFFLILTALRRVYLPTARSLKRLDAATHAPVIGYLNATLEGLTIIKATNINSILIKEFDKHQDLYTSAHYTLQISIKAFTLWLDLMCTLFITAVISRFLIFETDMLVGFVGLAITQAFQMTEKLEFGIRQWAEIENQMTAVERTLQYAKPKQKTLQGCIIENWPETGEVIYEKVCLKYPNRNEPILSDITFHIKSGERIGIVGRTGAGKSSLLSTLFRLYEVDGGIYIGGVDIKTLSLKLLRSKISIIPQSPTLFSGTIRENIDPENIYSDEQVSEAISAANLDRYIDNLDYRIDSGGNSLSAGQKQLICIARAIVRQNKIIVLDEATANLDPITDDLIQNVLKINFKSYTLLVIAHRIHTILNCDRVMVINNGQIQEFDRPKTLQQIEGGLFRRMLEGNEDLLTA